MVCDDGHGTEQPVIEFLNLVLFDADDHYILRDMGTGKGTNISKEEMTEERIQGLIDDEGWERVNIWEDGKKQ